MVDAISFAIAGLNAQSARVGVAASKIANAQSTNSGAPIVDVAEEIVNLKQALTTYKANAAVVTVASDMSKTLLNSFDKTV